MSAADERKDAFERWSKGLSALDDSISAYELTTAQLHRFLDPVAVGSGRLSLEDSYAYINEKFSVLEDLENRLSRARLDLHALRNNSLKLVPINRLHPEILSTIFLLGAAQQEFELNMADSVSSDSEISDDLDAQIPFAVLVSHVCRHWRAVALETAVLWTKIDFAEKPPYEFTKTMLSRSKLAPLDVSFTLSDSEEGDQIEQAMKIMKPHIPRVYDLAIDAYDTTQISDILFHFLTDSPTLPPLNSLTITDGGSEEPILFNTEALKHRLAQIFVLLRNIKHLNLESVKLPYSSPAFHALTTLKLYRQQVAHQPNEDEFRSILVSSPDLETLVLEETGIRILSYNPRRGNDISVSGPRIDMHKLHTLRLISVPWSEIEFALHAIHPTDLRSLRIAAPEDRWDEDGIPIEDDDAVVGGVPRDEHVLKSVARFLFSISANQATSPVVSLHIEAISMEENCTASMIELIRAAPNIINLTLTDTLVDDALLRKMCIPSSGKLDGVLCPNLATLKISRIHDLTYEALLSMVKSRHKAYRKIQSFKLECELEDNLDAIKQYVGVFHADESY